MPITALSSATLWIDGVGAFRMLLADEVVVGRIGDSAVSVADEPEIALMGNLSRMHLTIRRSGEEYVVTPFAKTMLNGRLIAGPTVLSSPSDLLLNDVVRLKFEMCSALSASARVDVLSNHRGKQAVNGFVLMAETCLLGPGAQTHVRCPLWPSQLVLVRRDDGLAVNGKGLTINGESRAGWTQLERGQTIVGDGLRLRLE